MRHDHISDIISSMQYTTYGICVFPRPFHGLSGLGMWDVAELLKVYRVWGLRLGCQFRTVPGVAKSLLSVSAPKPRLPDHVLTSTLNPKP